MSSSWNTRARRAVALCAVAVVTEAKAVDVEPPEISLDLSAASNPVAYNGGADPNNVVFSGTQLTIPQYATHCNVKTDNADTCRRVPKANSAHRAYMYKFPRGINITRGVLT